MRKYATKLFAGLVLLFLIALPSFANVDKKAEKPWTINELKLKENDPKYEIKCQFPQFKETLGANVEQLNKKIETLVKERAIESKNHFEKRESKNEMGSYLDLSTSIYRATKDLLSVVFTIETYASGSAHPSHWTQSLTYDLKRGRFLKLGMVLNNDSNYLTTVSRLCVADLKKVDSLDEAWIQNGAGPKAANFETFFLDNDSLAIIFDEYKVGPYSAGAQSVKIPYSKLKDTLNPDLGLN